MKTKELIAAGHALAKELHCAESAALVRELATQLDCTALALREMTKKRDAGHADVLAWEKTMFKACGEDGLKSVAEKFAELQARCAALAAENAGLKKYICDECYVENIKTGATKCAGLGMPETPATDAFLAEVRAQGADECVRQLVTSDDDGFSDAPNICAMVAHQIRKGVQS